MTKDKGKHGKGGGDQKSMHHVTSQKPYPGGQMWTPPQDNQSMQQQNYGYPNQYVMMDPNMQNGMQGEYMPNMQNGMPMQQMQPQMMQMHGMMQPQVMQVQMMPVQSNQMGQKVPHMGGQMSMQPMPMNMQQHMPMNMQQMPMNMQQMQLFPMPHHSQNELMDYQQVQMPNMSMQPQSQNPNMNSMPQSNMVLQAQNPPINQPNMSMPQQQQRPIAMVPDQQRKPLQPTQSSSSTSSPDEQRKLKTMDKPVETIIEGEQERPREKKGLKNRPVVRNADTASKVGSDLATSREPNSSLSSMKETLHGMDSPHTPVRPLPRFDDGIPSEPKSSSIDPQRKGRKLANAKLTATIKPEDPATPASSSTAVPNASPNSKPKEPDTSPRKPSRTQEPGGRSPEPRPPSPSRPIEPNRPTTPSRPIDPSRQDAKLRQEAVKPLPSREELQKGLVVNRNIVPQIRNPEAVPESTGGKKTMKLINRSLDKSLNVLSPTPQPRQATLLAALNIDEPMPRDKRRLSVPKMTPEKPTSPDMIPLCPKLDMLAYRKTVSNLPRPANIAFARDNKKVDETPWGRNAAHAPAPKRPAKTSHKGPIAKQPEPSWKGATPPKQSFSEDEVVIRKCRTILNKLSMDNFEKLFAQLTVCGISKTQHIEALMKEVFEKATTQHGFIDMYTQLCKRLDFWCKSNPLLDVDFRRILLSQCQRSFESNLKPPEGILGASVNDEDAFEREVKYKSAMLGNIKFVGRLLVTQLIASKILVQAASQLLSISSEITLECLCALLLATGKEFDDPSWKFHDSMKVIYNEAQSLTKEEKIPSRIRFLLTDVFDCRSRNWESRMVNR